MKILVFGSCWPTNIGNAFVYMGITNTLKRALGDKAELFQYGSLSTYLFSQANYPENNLKLSELSDFDYIVIGGMTQCEEYFSAVEQFLEGFINKGTKIVISGGGAQDYSKEETDNVRKWMTKIPIYGFISRDSFAFQRFADLATYSLDGIDSAFFIAENFSPVPINKDYNVLNFDYMEEPILSNCPNYLRTVESKKEEKPRLSTLQRIKNFVHKDLDTNDKKSSPLCLDMQGKMVLRTNHAAWPTLLRNNDFESNYTLISDLPSDYLSLYAQADTVFSDRVHACIATLAFGNKAMLFGRNNPRIRMFERVGANEILNNPVKLDLNNLTKEKEKQVEFIRSILV